MINIDKSNLHRVILEYPNQLSLGQSFAEKIKLPQKKYSNLIICGMGGSALPGDLLISYFENNKKNNLPIFINRTYHLPKNASANSLIFISSYSGNTEEIISCFKEALEIKANVVAFTSGGEIETLAKKNNIPLVKYQINYPNFQPRYAVTYAFAAMHQILTKLNISDIIKEYPQINSSFFEETGKKLAKKIKGKTPVIYASNYLKIVAKNWKIKINENSKTPAFWNYFPELNHNEMVGFTNPQSNFFFIILKSENDEPIIKKRLETTCAFFKEKGLVGEIIEITGENYLERMLNGLVLGDWVSYYLALEYNHDPAPVDLVEDFKTEMKK